MMLTKKNSFFFKTKFVYRNNKLNVKGILFFSNIKNTSLSFLFLMILISNTLKKIQWL